ncbi:unnamed protein product [Sympodiomycopsis kandeliae]
MSFSRPSDLLTCSIIAHPTNLSRVTEEVFPRGFLNKVAQKVGACCSGPTSATSQHSASSAGHGSPTPSPVQQHNTSPTPVHQHTATSTPVLQHTTPPAPVHHSTTASVSSTIPSSSEYVPTSSKSRYDPSRARIGKQIPGDNAPIYSSHDASPSDLRALKKFGYQPASKPFVFLSGSSSSKSSHSSVPSPTHASLKGTSSPESPTVKSLKGTSSSSSSSGELSNQPHKGKEAMVASPTRTNISSAHSNVAGPSGTKGG